MKKNVGVYEVSGPLAFRDHRPGDVFMASLAPSVERRRIESGSLRLLERIGADLPRTYSLPGGWK